MVEQRQAWFTICSANYIAYAKTLFRSLKRADPDGATPFFLILVDEEVPGELMEQLPFEVILARDLGIPEFWDMALRYSVMEMNTAVKPAAFLHLFDRGFDAAVYLDPDIYVISELTEVKRSLRDGANVILTPHSTEPLEDGLDPDDVRLLRTGAYNLGFIACRRSDEARRLLEWWHRRMLAQCLVDLEAGLFVDQKFMDLAPAYAKGVEILRHTGYNVAYWNLASRPVTRQDGVWKAGDRDLVFFHFSGVIPGRKEVFSKHQNRFEVSNIGDLKDLLGAYIDELEAEGHSGLKGIPYAYGRFGDGSAIPDVYRRYIARTEPSRRLAREAAFAPSIEQVDRPEPNFPQGPIPCTKLMMQIWRERPDLQKSFHLLDDQGREAFARWFVSAAEREYGLPEAAYESVLASLKMLDIAMPGGRGPRRFSRQWLARQLIVRGSFARSLFRRLPAGTRSKVRNSVIRLASGHTQKSAQMQSIEKLDGDLSSGIGIYGYLEAVSGVGEGSRRMCEALKEADVPYSAHALKAHGHASQQAIDWLNLTDGASPYKCLLFHVNADEAARVLEALPAHQIDGRYRIGYWAWELAEFPRAWLGALDYFNEIWVPSRFVRDAVQKATDKQVHIVPHPVPEREDSGESRAQFSLPSDDYLFLCSLDLKSYSSRKNPMAAYEAFCRAFPADSGEDIRARLVVKLHGGAEQSEEDRQIVRRLLSDDRVILIDVPLSGKRYASLQRLCDGFISLHRSEGFGMNIAEAMRLGKPVIATAYSGNTDYFGATVGYPVRYKLVPVEPGQYPHGTGQVWAEPDIEHAASLLRRVYEHQEEARSKGRKASQHMIEHYSTAAVARIVRERYEKLAQHVLAGPEDK